MILLMAVEQFILVLFVVLLYYFAPSQENTSHTI